MAISGFALLALAGLWRFMPEPIGVIKRDGERINRVSLQPRIVASNYKKLFTNPCFFFGSIAIGLSGLPCLVWIALSPIILVADAKLSLIQYGIWQVPVFGATIVGNLVLHKITHRYSLKRLVLIGSIAIGVSLFVMLLLSFATHGYFIGLMPGLIIYFFALGLISAPLNRFILFSTEVSKGTASALMSMLTMLVLAFGIEGGNLLYSFHSNILFAFYLVVIGIGYFLFLSAAFLVRSVRS